MNNLGVLYVYTGRFEEAAEILPKTLEILREVGGDENPQTLQTMANLGAAYQRLGRLDDAIAVFEQALPLHERVLGPEHRATLVTAANLAALYGMRGEQGKRESLLTKTLATQRRVLGEDHMDTLMTRMNLAKVSYDRGEYEAAESEYADINARFSEHYPDHFLGGVVRTMHGRCLMELRRYEAAEGELKAAYEQVVATLGVQDRHTREIATTLADLYTRWDHPEEARGWREAGDDGAGPS